MKGRWTCSPLVTGDNSRAAVKREWKFVHRSCVMTFTTYILSHTPTFSDINEFLENFPTTFLHTFLTYPPYNLVIRHETVILFIIERVSSGVRRGGKKIVRWKSKFSDVNARRLETKRNYTRLWFQWDLHVRFHNNVTQTNSTVILQLPISFHSFVVVFLCVVLLSNTVTKSNFYRFITG